MSRRATTTTSYHHYCYHDGGRTDGTKGDGCRPAGEGGERRGKGEGSWKRGRRKQATDVVFQEHVCYWSYLGSAVEACVRLSLIGGLDSLDLI